MYKFICLIVYTQYPPLQVLKALEPGGLKPLCFTAWTSLRSKTAMSAKGEQVCCTECGFNEATS